MPRISALLQLYAFAVLGVFLVAAPWTPVWEQALSALGPSGWAEPLASGWVRGFVSGIGLLDVILAVRQAKAIGALRGASGSGPAS